MVAINALFTVGGAVIATDAMFPVGGATVGVDARFAAAGAAVDIRATRVFGLDLHKHARLVLQPVARLRNQVLQLHLAAFVGNCLVALGVDVERRLGEADRLVVLTAADHQVGEDLIGGGRIVVVSEDLQAQVKRVGRRVNGLVETAPPHDGITQLGEHVGRERVFSLVAPRDVGRLLRRLHRPSVQLQGVPDGAPLVIAAHEQRMRVEHFRDGEVGHVEEVARALQARAPRQHRAVVLVGEQRARTAHAQRHLVDVERALHERQRRVLSVRFASSRRATDTRSRTPSSGRPRPPGSR